MVLTVATPGVEPDHGQERVRSARIGARVPGQHLARKLLGADPADARRGTGEVTVDELRRQADRLEDLCTAVGRDGRDAHLGERLQDPLADPLHGSLLRHLGGHPVGEQALIDELAERLEHQVRVDRRGAVADQRRDAVHAPRLAGLDDEACLEARSLADEMMMNRRDCEECRYRGAVRADSTVGQDEDVHPDGEHGVGLTTEALEGSIEPRRALGHRPRRIQRVCLEDRGVHLAQLLELGVEQDRRGERQLARMLRRLREEVLLRPDARREAHHDRLANRVDRWIRDLGEELLEVRVEDPVAAREHRERRVVPHRADGLLGIAGERREGDLHVLLRVAESDLALAKRLGRGDARLAGGEIGELYDLVVEPFRVRLLRRDGELRLVVRHDPALLEVDEEELAGLQSALPEDVRCGDVEHTGFGREHDPPVARLEPSPRSQAVAIERRSDHPAVGERDGGGAVPGLHQALVVGVEAERAPAADRCARRSPRGSSS